LNVFLDRLKEEEEEIGVERETEALEREGGVLIEGETVGETRGVEGADGIEWASGCFLLRTLRDGEREELDREGVDIIGIESSSN
jgi:hypothetical protein